jgi:glycosyltransferase involved in cell wall biosynthesis
MNNPLISVALCTYNGAEYIKQQLDSIVNQTYKNMEVIVVDDCSTDATYAIIEEYASRDKRVKCFLNEQNLGFNKNFEKALSLTSGEYIAISDQDDIWVLTKLQTLIDNIGNNWLAFSNSAYMSQEGELTGKLLLKDFDVERKSFISFLMQNYVTGHTTLLSREILKYAFPFPTEGFYDWWMGFVAMYHHKLIYVDSILTHYRVHPQSVIQRELSTYSDDLALNKRHWNLQIMQLNAFTGYRNLKSTDRDLIINFINAIKIKRTKALSIPLIGLVSKYYDYLFPDQKPRKGLSRWNFAFKYSKGQFAFK